MFDLLISYNFYCSYTPSKAETQGKKLVGGMQIDDEDESTEEEDDADDHVPAFDGGYNPADFENLPVSADIKELFQYIGRYTPQQVINLNLIRIQILCYHQIFLVKDLDGWCSRYL